VVGGIDHDASGGHSERCGDEFGVEGVDEVDQAGAPQQPGRSTPNWPTAPITTGTTRGAERRFDPEAIYTEIRDLDTGRVVTSPALDLPGDDRPATDVRASCTRACPIGSADAATGGHSGSCRDTVG
jgi:hypothetical protein